MFNSGNGRLFYLLLIIIGSSGLGLGIHSASATCGDAPSPHVNYNGCNLSGQNFAGLDLSGATFVGADITGTNFNGAKLVTSDFTGVTNAGATTTFLNSNLTRAIFINANPTHAVGAFTFENSDLTDTNFSGTDLNSVSITSGALITRTNFSGADLSNVDFTKAIMHDTIFSSTTIIVGTIFNLTDMSGLHLTHLDLSGASSFAGVNFSGANLTGTSFQFATISTGLDGSTTVNPSFHNADLSYVDFTGATIASGADFTGAIFTGTILACTGNPICHTGSNPPPVIHFDSIVFAGGALQTGPTTWQISASSSSGSHVQYTGVYATIGTTDTTHYPVSCTPNNTIFPLGSNLVTCTATDPINPANTSAKTFTVIISNNIPPTVTPSANPVIAEATSASGAAVYYHVHAYDIVDGNIPITGSTTPPLSYCTPGNGTTFALGSTIVICNVADPTHPSDVGTASFTVTVQDTTHPSITTFNQTIQATGPSGATVTYHATAFDLVDGHITPTCTPSLNGTTFALGTTTLTCSATDSHSNTSSKQLTILVHDTLAPVITVPADVSIQATGTSTQVTFGNATATDIVDSHPRITYSGVPNPFLNSTSHLLAGSFSIGTTVVTWTATDASGNTVSATQSINVNSNVPVTITAPSNVVSEATGTLTQVNLGTPSFTDPVDHNPSITNNAPGGFPVGSTTVTWNLLDKYGNHAQDQQVVTIHDTTSPSITTGNVTTEATGPSGATVTYHATAFDLVDGHITPTCTPSLNGTTFVLGTTTLTCSATDSHSNTSSKQLTILVHDTTGPVINLPSNPIIVEAVNQNGATVSYSVTATDIVTGPVPTSKLSCTPASGIVYGLGQTTVVCTATDNNSTPNTSTAHFNVIVQDTTPPTITAPPSITKQATGTLTQVTLGTPTVSDTVDPNPIVTNNAPTNGFPIGTTIVTWTATDHAGNFKTSTQTIIILPINTPGKVNGEGSFGKNTEFNMNVQSKDGLTFKGHFDYDDKLAKIDLDSKTITSLFVDNTVTKANFTGTGTVNGQSGYTFKAYVIDNGNPGKNDFFQIAIFDNTSHQVYANSGKLVHGNLHVSNKGDVDEDKFDSDSRDK